MKRVSIVIVMLLISTYVYAQDKEPERPINVPSYARWDENGWEIQDGTTILCNTVRWYPNGKVWALNYLTNDDKVEIIRYFYKNGNKQYVESKLNYNYYYHKYRNKKTFKTDGSRLRIGDFQEYYENGKLKIDKYYNLVIEETEKEIKVKTELCGDETYYDENGNVTKKVSHGGKCPEYNLPELTAEELLDKMAEKSFKKRFGFLPEIGKVKKWNGDKKITVTYRSGFELKKGDCVIWKEGRKLLFFKCMKNENETGYFDLASDDTFDKYKAVKEGDQLYFVQCSYDVDRNAFGGLTKRKVGETMEVGNIEFVYIPGGERIVDVKGRKKRIKVKSFWISKYEMTEGDYLKYCCDMYWFMRYTGKEMNFSSKYPVNLGDDSPSPAQYCVWFAERCKVKARLAEENEWIYAASGGAEWQKKMKENMNEYAWYSVNSGGAVHKVGEKAPNDYGLYDMNGNAWEWINGHSLIGGSYNSGNEEMKRFDTIFVNEAYWSMRAKGIKKKAPWANATDTCTSFRIVIDAE